MFFYYFRNKKITTYESNKMVIFTKKWLFYSGQNEPLSTMAMQGIAVSQEQGVATPCSTIPCSTIPCSATPCSIYHGVTINMSH